MVVQLKFCNAFELCFFRLTYFVTEKFMETKTRNEAHLMTTHHYAGGCYALELQA